MKFLFISRFKDTYLTLAPEKRAGLQAATMSYLDRCMKSGYFLEGYYLADMKGMVSIWNVSNSEEGARLDLENPTNSYVDNEIIPLIEMDAARKVMKEMAESAQKATKK